MSFGGLYFIQLGALFCTNAGTLLFFVFNKFLVKVIDWLKKKFKLVFFCIPVPVP